MNYNDFQTFIFDCDGVLLNSNKVKTQAFYNTALPYGIHAAQKLVRYHVANGGISRYKKFQYFLDEIVDKSINGPDLEQLLSYYAAEVQKALLACDVADKLEDIKNKYPKTKWMIVSGGDQAELRELFKIRQLAHLFDAGIFGSPDTKDHILASQQSLGNIELPAIFFGDSRYDEEVAKNANMTFVFVSEWSESDHAFSLADDKINKLSDLISR